MPSGSPPQVYSSGISMWRASVTAMPSRIVANDAPVNAASEAPYHQNARAQSPATASSISGY
jgi:hypothetical protein